MKPISFRKLGPTDVTSLRALRQLYVDVFNESTRPVDDGYLQMLLANAMLLFFVAESGGRIIGGATTHRLPSVYGAYDELYIYDMAVASDRQRQGIGSKLLDFIKEYAKSEPITTIFVQADAPDMHARNFYIKNGGIEEDVRHYDFKIKG